MKKTLLSSSAIAGAALLAAPVASPAFAGTPEVSDNFTVSLGGVYRFTVLAYDQDERGVRGRGYHFQTDDGEIYVRAGGVADNGLEYGFEIELNARGDLDAATDETWAYLRGNWGEVNLGDQDDAADRMAIGGEDAMAGRGGYDGPLGDAFNFSGENIFTNAGATFTGDATKVTYFTPRFFGFQLGASWTPDSAGEGVTGSNSVDADLGTAGTVAFENSLSGGINYAEDFGGFGVIVSATGAYSESLEIDGIDQDEAWQGQLGARVTYAGFQLGAAYGYADNKLGGDEEAWFADIGLNYSTGPWKVGTGYLYSETDGATDAEVQIYQVGANYQVAPGFELASDINFIEEDNAVAADNEGTVFVFSTIFSF